MRFGRLRFGRLRIVVQLPMNKPKVAITVGDPAGIGPEIAERAAADDSVRDVCEPVLFGPPSTQYFTPGLLSADAGRAAHAAIVRAVDAARSAVVDAIATAPVNKEAFRLAGLPWTGHTDLLAHLTGQDVVAFTGSGETGAAIRGDKNVVASFVRVNVEADSLNAEFLDAPVTVIPAIEIDVPDTTVS